MFDITTNNHIRPLIGWNELTDKERTWFDYIESPEDAVFFRYRGNVYDYNEIPIAPHNLKALGWDGALPESLWTAVVVRCFDKEGYPFDGVVVGYYVEE